MSSSKLEIEGSLDGLSGGSGEEGSSEGKAPSEFLAECLSASLRRRYGAALRYCRLILRHEPTHRAARALLPTLRTRAAHTDNTQEEDATVENLGDSSASATDSSYSAGGAERSRSDSRHSEPSRLELSRSECSSEPSRSESVLEDAASDCVSELDLESELEDEPLDDLDTYTSNTGTSSSHEMSDSSGGVGGGAACDDNGNCTAAAAAAAAAAADVRNDNAPALLSDTTSTTTTTTLLPPHSHGDYHRDTRTVALDNDLRHIKNYQLRKSCAH